jgi:hypothetical protein
MTVFDLDSAVDGLVEAVSPLSMRAKAALFGSCGTALLPLLDHVERATAGKWSFPAARAAAGLIADFATGTIPEDSYEETRQILLESGPNGHELDSPWSTYAQDALVCVDAGLVAASVNGRDEFKPAWIFSAVEPTVASLNYRGYDVEFDAVDIGSTDRQREMDAAVDFLSAAIVRLARLDEVSSVAYAQLVNEAQAIVPPVDRGRLPRW